MRKIRKKNFQKKAATTPSPHLHKSSIDKHYHLSYFSNVNQIYINSILLEKILAGKKLDRALNIFYFLTKSLYNILTSSDLSQLALCIKI